MGKKEMILLDARLHAAISKRAFYAELDNGHRLVAFLGCGYSPDTLRGCGEKVQVEMSPYDMSKGRIVFDGG